MNWRFYRITLCIWYELLELSSFMTKISHVLHQWTYSDSTRFHDDITQTIYQRGHVALDSTKRSRQHMHQTHEYRERVRKRRVQHSTTLNNDATERENSWLVKTADNVRANCERESEVRLGVMFGSCNEQWVDATRCRPPLSPQSKVLQRTPRRRTTQRTHKLQALHSRHSPLTQ